MCDCDEVQKWAVSFHEAENVDWCGNDCERMVVFPYQHQIQQQIFQYGSCSFKKLQDFYNWCIVQRKERENSIKGRSMEELWLMFYMWREHYKLWDGEKWVDEKKL